MLLVARGRVKMQCGADLEHGENAGRIYRPIDVSQLARHGAP